MRTLKKTSYNPKPSNVFLGLFLSISFVISFNVQGQKRTADSVTFYSRSQLDSLLKVKVSPESVSRLLGKSKDNEPYMVISRTKPGDVEIHELYDDVAIIRSGSGTLKTGYQVKGQKESGQAPSREWRGGVIENGKDRSLSPGDFIVIPAMLGHQYIPNTGDSLTYWTIKVRSAKVSNR